MRVRVVRIGFRTQKKPNIRLTVRPEHKARLACVGARVIPAVSLTRLQAHLF
jgi:hypothetical protein